MGRAGEHGRGAWSADAGLERQCLLRSDSLVPLLFIPTSVGFTMGWVRQKPTPDAFRIVVAAKRTHRCSAQGR